MLKNPCTQFVSHRIHDRCSYSGVPRSGVRKKNGSYIQPLSYLLRFGFAAKSRSTRYKKAGLGQWPVRSGNVVVGMSKSRISES